MNCKIYIASSSADAELLENDNKYKYVSTIQGGKALTLTDSGADYRDDDGDDNISEKNKVYCELTVLYWIWKNSTSDYVGLEHYRRRFDCSEKMIEQYFEDGYEVILPEAIASPPLEQQYAYYHYTSDWKLMVDILREQYPDFYETAKVVFSGKVLIPYNMGIYKREYFEEYCEWLFSILMEVEKRSCSKKDVYQNRYIGFLAERLQTLYVFHQMSKKRYKYVHLPVKQLRTKSSEAVKEIIRLRDFKEHIYFLHSKNQISKAKEFYQESHQLIKMDDEAKVYGILYKIYDAERKCCPITLFDQDLALEEQVARWNTLINIFKKADLTKAGIAGIVQVVKDFGLNGAYVFELLRACRDNWTNDEILGSIQLFFTLDEIPRAKEFFYEMVGKEGYNDKILTLDIIFQAYDIETEFNEKHFINPCDTLDDVLYRYEKTKFLLRRYDFDIPTDDWTFLEYIKQYGISVVMLVYIIKNSIIHPTKVMNVVALLLAEDKQWMSSIRLLKIAYEYSKDNETTFNLAYVLWQGGYFVEAEKIIGELDVQDETVHSLRNLIKRRVSYHE